jgi:hypothetical protein
LASFAGCFDKSLGGVEYEDCYFEIEGLSPALLQWFGDTLNGLGPQVMRDLTVEQVEAGQSKITPVAVTRAFLRDFRVSDADAVSNSPGSLRFVAVPEVLTFLPTQPGTTPPTNNILFLVADFRFAVPNVNGSRVDAVRGIHMSLPKIVAPPIGSRHRFLPGAPQFDGIELDAGEGGTTITDLEAWANAVAQGRTDVRDGDLQFLSPGRSTVLTDLHFQGLSPTTGFPPFPTSSLLARPIDLTVGSFLFQ